MFLSSPQVNAGDPPDSTDSGPRRAAPHGPGRYNPHGPDVRPAFEFNTVADDYLSLTVHSRPDESPGDFKTRLSAFWTLMLRNHPDDFEKVYAETVEFDRAGDRLTRQYLIEAEVAGFLEIQLRESGMEFEPIDADEVFSKFEATPPEWMWIEH